MKSLIQLQQDCIDRMLEVRTSESRMYKNHRAARKALRIQLEKRGYSEADIKLLVKDATDVYELEINSDED